MESAPPSLRKSSTATSPAFAWADVTLSVVIDAVVCDPATPGRIHRTAVGELPPTTGTAGSHGFGIPEAVELGRVLHRMPRRLIVYAVEAFDLSLGLGLSSPVTTALPALVDAVLSELSRGSPMRYLINPTEVA
jgi:hydrogenase maturation protease